MTDLSQTVSQNGDNVKVAAAEKDIAQSPSQGKATSPGDMSDSSPSSNSLPGLTVKGTENGLQRQIIAHDFTNQVLAYVVTAAFFALIVLLMFVHIDSADSGVKDLLFALLGVIATGWANIIGFYFGSSAGSAQKSQTISSVLLHSNPAESPSGS
jgi:hypothetical protein